MTTHELKALEATKETWKAFMQLPEMHPDDQNEFRFHIHALQNIIFAREGIRQMNSLPKYVSVQVISSDSPPIDYEPIELPADISNLSYNKP